jgi:hypothetical protein
MDKLVGQFMRIAGDDTMLMFATALSQQPYLKYESVGGHRFYRPRDVAKLLSRLGINPVKVEPVMTHQFLARFASEADAQEAKFRLERARSDAGPVFGIDSSDAKSVYFGCQLRQKVEKDAWVQFGNDDRCKFFELFYEMEGIKSGRHHPDGCLWIRNGHHRIAADKVSILDILPTILDFFDISSRGYAGRSLLRPAIAEPVLQEPDRVGA